MYVMRGRWTPVLVITLMALLIWFAVWYGGIDERYCQTLRAEDFVKIENAKIEGNRGKTVSFDVVNISDAIVEKEGAAIAARGARGGLLGRWTEYGHWSKRKGAELEAGAKRHYSFEAFKAGEWSGMDQPWVGPVQLKLGTSFSVGKCRLRHFPVIGSYDDEKGRFVRLWP